MTQMPVLTGPAIYTAADLDGFSRYVRTLNGTRRPVPANAVRVSAVVRCSSYRLTDTTAAGQLTTFCFVLACSSVEFIINIISLVLVCIIVT